MLEPLTSQHARTRAHMRTQGRMRTELAVHLPMGNSMGSNWFQHGLSITCILLMQVVSSAPALAPTLPHYQVFETLGLLCTLGSQQQGLLGMRVCLVGVGTGGLLGWRNA